MDSWSADGVPGVRIARLARYLPTVLNDYAPSAPLTARLLSGGALT